MSIRTILTTAAGHGIDLLDPTPAQYRPLEWVAEHLAKENRFNGATPGVTYAVAQHVVIGAYQIYRETRDRTAAALFLFHDNVESALKDDTTPKKRAIAELIEAKCGVLAGQILDCFRDLEDRHQCAVHQAYGLPWPVSAEHKRIVKAMDLRMFVTEWRDLMRGIAHPDWASYAHIVPLADPIHPVSWAVARDLYLAAARKLLPDMRAAA